ncbi:MAG: hypothetical protein ABIQ93_03765 [Saprospiraceae bacterium]
MRTNIQGLFLLLSVSLLVTLSNCDKNPATPEPACDNGCLFRVKDASGTIIKMACFNRYAIETHYPETDSIIYGVPDQLDASLEEEGKTVKFSGTFRANTLQPTFPDPSFSPERIYQMEITDIK